MTVKIEKYNVNFRSQIIDIWEESVRATHHFLHSTDFDFYKSMVKEIDFTAFDVFCILTESSEMAGFFGVADKKLEMLFLKPSFIGQGIGKLSLGFALNELKITEVDVNEDNINAVIFYQKNGFKIYDRMPLDSTNKPYPILKMKL
ncbi:Peptidyl-lysine N-acetyltransferase YjaB [Emticicia aquatica]|uniref:Peptidyl-lysine N-acetyltransferase YjaB n=1 Tax=Emticicia aquatica TaxID=1681835 RepID=A0ABM9AQE6_9BACT|nr:GNAT family N-acetyltransferase [Emticicia aquatica]CAH0995704.1 Peptidyl-lysine N-acetyltransferase YjaB [Emticicia aquatica]